MLNVTAGPNLLRLIRVAYRSNVPVMLHGRHGVGKSELFLAAARELEIDSLVRDLSLMEPPDLVGMPEIRDGRTRFCPPTMLPEKGKGLFVLEEINRAPVYMRAPALQLLTARTLNDYRLPDGWLPVAAVNDAEGDYQVAELDPALLSRFLHVKVEPDRTSWCAWARTTSVHPAVIAFVQTTPDAFELPEGNPRSWTLASKILAGWESQRDAQASDLVVLLAGVLGDTYAHALARTYHSKLRLPGPREIVEQYRQHRPLVQGWVSKGRLDLLATTWSALRDALLDSAFRNDVTTNATRAINLATFASDLPADLGGEAATWLRTHGLLRGERP